MPAAKVGPEAYALQYNPRLLVTNLQAKMATRAEKSVATRRRPGWNLDVRYGPGPKETLDVFPGDAPGRPIMIYFHGGFWFSGDKAGNTCLMNPVLDAGGCVALPNFDLCPDVSLSELIAEARRSVVWVYHNAKRFNGDPERVFVSGSSSGAHVAAMVAAHDWSGDGLPADLIKGVALSSGPYDVEPLIELPENEKIGLKLANIPRVRPLLNPPCGVRSMTLTVGGDESEAWKAMTHDYAKVCQKAGLTVNVFEIPNEDHVTVSDLMADPASPVAKAILEQMQLGGSTG